jgi:site-specific DNA recombinase
LNKKVTKMIKIPAYKKLKVAIYCRVSTLHNEQLNSLSNQISYYNNLVNLNLHWELVDVYSDTKSGKNTSGRNEFKRMMEDCENHKIDLIITKSISRFGRNTVEILEILNNLNNLCVDVFFENEDIHSKDTSSRFLITLLESFAQAESESRSHNIKWGIKRKSESGISKLYNRKCFGYGQDNEGTLIIIDDEALTVKRIFDLYLSGYSILGIIHELENNGIKSPTGRDRWCKRTIELMLTNEKYSGNVLLGKTYCKGFPNNKRRVNNDESEKYYSTNNHVPIISAEKFELIQEERIKRSNITLDDTGVKRKSTHYSMR